MRAGRGRRSRWQRVSSRTAGVDRRAGAARSRSRTPAYRSVDVVPAGRPVAAPATTTSPASWRLIAERADRGAADADRLLRRGAGDRQAAGRAADAAGRRAALVPARRPAGLGGADRAGPRGRRRSTPRRCSTWRPGSGRSWTPPPRRSALAYHADRTRPAARRRAAQGGAVGRAAARRATDLGVRLRGGPHRSALPVDGPVRRVVAVDGAPATTDAVAALAAALAGPGIRVGVAGARPTRSSGCSRSGRGTLDVDAAHCCASVAAPRRPACPLVVDGLAEVRHRLPAGRAGPAHPAGRPGRGRVLARAAAGGAAAQLAGTGRAPGAAAGWAACWTCPAAERRLLLDTLEIWVATGGSVRHTAELAHCHRNTVINRLHRIAADHRPRLRRSGVSVELGAGAARAACSCRQAASATDGHPLCTVHNGIRPNVGTAAMVARRRR